jgi:hypothetical protein
LSLGGDDGGKLLEIGTLGNSNNLPVVGLREDASEDRVAMFDDGMIVVLIDDLMMLQIKESNCRR